MTVRRENPTARLVEVNGRWWHEDPADPRWLFLGFAPCPATRLGWLRYHVLHGLMMRYRWRDIAAFSVHHIGGPQ